MEGYVGQQVVGIDLHRRRTVIVRSRAARRLETFRLGTSRALTEVIARAGRSPEVVLEATYGWYWAVDVLQESGARVHLAHPWG